MNRATRERAFYLLAKLYRQRLAGLPADPSAALRDDKHQRWKGLIVTGDEAGFRRGRVSALPFNSA